MSYDLFVSYSRRDNGQGRITQLVNRIQQDFAAFAGRELAPFFDQQEIDGMQDWRQRILQGLRESRLLLACLSPSYLNSPYCEWEFVEYLKYEIGHLQGLNGVAPIYFVPVPGWNDREFDQRCAAWVAELRRRQHFDLRPWDEEGEGALREAAVRDRMAKLNQQIAEVILRGERAEKSLGNVDAHNPHFIGRRVNLRLLRENFVKPGNIGVVTAVNGVGGLGKTALAIEYAHAFAEEYGGGRWQVRCAGRDDLRGALADLATPLGFEFTDDEKKDSDRQFERTRRELKKLADAHEPHRCLLLLDNVDRPGLLDPAQVARINAGDWLHVLATTRLGEHELHGSRRDRTFLAVDELPPEDALALIESYQPYGEFSDDAEREAARAIVQVLGCFTLAVESAAVYLGQYAYDVTCAAFLARLKKEGLEGLDRAAGQSSEGVLHGEKRLGATLQPTLERLLPGEKLTLEFAALLAPDHVPVPWLRALVAKSFPEMERDAEPGYPDPWKNVLRRLLSLRLLQPTEVWDASNQPRVTRLHRLVQQLMLSNCPPERLARLQVGVDRFVGGRGDALGAITDWETARWELAPLDAVARLWDELGRPLAFSLLSQVGVCWLDLAEFGRCEPLFRRALANAERVFGPEHFAVARSLSDLALLLEATNRPAEAEPLLRRSLAVAEESLGPDHPLVATILGNLAALLQKTNRLVEAELLTRRAWAINEKSYGPVDRHIATNLNNLASLLEARNQMAEAESLYRRAIAIAEQSLGPEHPRVAHSLNNLALLLKATNRIAEAEPLMRRALAIEEKSYGPDHPDVARDLHNLAQLLQDACRPAEAEVLIRRAVSLWEKSLGIEHPLFAVGLCNLAKLLQATHRPVEAEPLMRRGVSILEKSLGPDHPDVATVLNNLASLLQETDRLAEAEPLMRRALAIYERHRGPEHPFVASALHNLADLLLATSRVDEAESLYRRTLAIREKALPPDHPDIMLSVQTLALFLNASGRFEEAVHFFVRVLETREHTTGTEQFYTLRWMNDYCATLRKQGQAAPSEPLARRVSAISAQVFGNTHPLSIHRASNLALTLTMLGKSGEACGILAANWGLNVPPHANTTPRIVFLRYVAAVFESQPGTLFLGQLKTLLSGPELPVAPGVAVPWDIAYFLEFLRPRVQAGEGLLAALVAALNDRSKLPELERFDEWRAVAVMPLDAPWPESLAASPER